MTENVQTILTTIADQLASVYEHDDEAYQAAWWLLQTLLHTTKAELLAQGTITLNDLQEQTLTVWIDQHVNHNKPLQYILGTVPFADLTLFVEPPTLIPRPETEEWCLQLIETLQPVADKKLSILDLCTGSGCIALTLANALPHSTVIATDISQAALDLTQKNATYNRITNVKCIKSNLYHDIPDSMKFDIIVSNPPYIAFDEWKQLEPSVREWEDQQALVADKQGLYIIENIIKRAPEFLKQDSILTEHNIPQLAIEIGYNQGAVVRELMIKAGFNSATVWQDMSENDRLVINQRI